MNLKKKENKILKYIYSRKNIEKKKEREFLSYIF